MNMKLGKKALNAQRPKWTRFVLGTVNDRSDADLHAQAQATGVPFDVIKQVHQDIAANEIVWVNSLYQVNVRVEPSIHEGWPRMIHLSIKLRTKQPIHDWRDLQRIKNELVGPENEGLELYPAESRLVDSANQYHMYVFEDPTFRINFGFKGRFVLGINAGGAVQRPMNKE
jgi:hypothetical protein